MAINTSRCVLIILSETYLAQPWCKYELQKSLEAQVKQNKQIVIVKLGRINWNKVHSTGKHNRAFEHTCLAWPEENVPFYEDQHRASDGNNVENGGLQDSFEVVGENKGLRILQRVDIKDIPLERLPANKFCAVFQRMKRLLFRCKCFSRQKENTAYFERQKEVFWSKLLVTLYRRDSVCGLSPVNCIWSWHEDLH